MAKAFRQVALALGLFAAPGVNTMAQVPNGRRELVGVVRDPRGVGIEGATVEVPGGGARTDLKGTFRIFTGDIDTLTIAVRRPGYSPIEALITARNRQWDTVVVELEQVPAGLDEVRVEGERILRTGLKGFEERKGKQNGIFITREDIVARNSLRLSDVLQTRRGVQLVRIGTNRYGVRFATYSGTKGSGCIPTMWVDGQRAVGMEIDDLPANTVEGVELYDSFATVPFDFSQNVNNIGCGTIVVWTRPPGTKKP